MSAHRVASARVLLLILMAIGPGLALLTLSAQAPAAQTVFRSAAVLVPVDVRVLDRKGVPVTDLKADDFTVFEDGKPQQIRHFSALALTPDTPDANVPLRRVGGAAATIPPQNRRLFLIVLGRGRLQGPSKGLDALLTFVRERLLPQDLVALMAWNRATDFTIDREKVAAVIERFKPRHESIEAYLQLLYSGLSGLYAGRQIPRAIQVKIDDVFHVPAAGTREVLAGATTDKAAAEAGRQADLLLRKSEIEARASAYRQFNTTDRTLGDLMAEPTMGANFDDYVALSRQTLQDVGNVYAGIDYLRFIDGEKHLIFVTEQGFLLPSADYDRDVAALASDARVAIDTFQTGGVATQMVDGFALGALRTVSETSGGQFSVSDRGVDAINRIAHATEFGYVLGYAPANPALDGKFRKIKVEVRRKSVTVAFRHGYFARPDESFDPRKSIAMTRMVAAANFNGNIQDLKISMKVTDAKTGGGRTVTVETFVPVDRLVFAKTSAGSLAAIGQAVLCTDAHGDSVGELWRTVDVNVPIEEYDRVRQTGLRLSITVPVTVPPAWVKVIIYDYGSDLLGTTKTRRY
jgi:VWFA-related protein